MFISSNDNEVFTKLDKATVSDQEIRKILESIITYFTGYSNLKEVAENDPSLLTISEVL